MEEPPVGGALPPFPVDEAHALLAGIIATPERKDAVQRLGSSFQYVDEDRAREHAVQLATLLDHALHELATLRNELDAVYRQDGQP